MNEKLTFSTVPKDSDEKSAKALRESFSALMHDYINEMNLHSKRPLPEKYQQKWIDSIIASQGDPDRHLELCFYNGEELGFLFGKVDHEGQKGYIRPGCAYIMEFYIKPEARRRGFGRLMLERLEALFIADGAELVYLTADPITGKPFWEAMDFTCTGEISPENGLYFYGRRLRA